MRFRTGLQVVTEVSAAIPWVWEGFLARGHVTGLSGTPKVGKSTLVGGLLHALTSGRPEFLGCGLPNAPTPVVLITEESERSVRLRLDTWHQDALQRLHLAAREDLVQRPPWPQLVAAGADLAEQVGSDLLVLDTMRGLAGLPDGAEADGSAMTRVLRPAQDAAARGLAVLVLHHDRKLGGAYGEGASGSNALVGALDCLVTMKREKGDSDSVRRTLDALGRWEQQTQTVERGPNGYVLLGEASAVRSEMEERLVLGLIADRARTIKEVKEAWVEATGQKRGEQRIAEMLHGLARRGLATETGEGKRGSPFLFVSHPFDGDAGEESRRAA